MARVFAVSSAPKRRIFAMGGGGFSEGSENINLDSYFFSLCQKKRPKVCFVSTASGDSVDYTNRFYEGMKKHEVQASHLSLFKAPLGSLQDFVLDKDVIYVGGGNTRNLTVLWKEWGLDLILREAYAMGKVLGGVSAGSLCWFEQGVTDSIPGQLNALNCFGFLKGSNCPHYDGEIERRPAYHKLILAGMKDGLACDDDVAAVFENEQLIEFVSSRPAANGYILRRQGNQITEELVRPKLLT